VPGGLPTLQGWIRSETLPKRIPHANPSKRGRPKSTDVSPESAYTRQWRQANRDLASQYLCRLDTRSSETGTDWHLQVSEVQLTAADESLKQALYAFLFAPPDPVSPELLSTYASNVQLQRAMLSNAEANPVRLCHFETLVDAGICQNETLDPAQICHFDTLVDGLNYYFETLIEAGICQFDTIIKILNKLKYAPFINQETIPSKIAAQAAGSAYEKLESSTDNRDKDWDYNKLMRGINPELRKRIQNLGLEKSFLAWLIAGSLNAEIHSPVSFAIATVLENQQTPPGPAARLADLQAGELSRMLKKTMRRMEQNYLGPAINSGAGSEDLESLLQPVADNPGRLKLLRRLADALDVKD